MVGGGWPDIVHRAASHHASQQGVDQDAALQLLLTDQELPRLGAERGIKFNHLLICGYVDLGGRRGGEGRGGVGGKDEEDEEGRESVREGRVCQLLDKPNQ